MGPQKNHLNETVLLSTQNICQKLCVTKFYQFDAENFCLSKPVTVIVCCFVALHPKSTAMVIAGRSVHLTTLFPGQA